MNKRFFLIPIAATLLLTACHQTTEAPQLRSQTDTLSWALGENVAMTIKQMPTSAIDEEVVMQAIQYTLKGGEQPISDADRQQAIHTLILKQQSERKQQPQVSQNNIDQAQKDYFVKLTQENPQVKQHPSGFYYEVLKPGKGPNAQLGKRIKFDYRSSLMLSGEPYDQTYGNRDPIIHVVGKPMFQGLMEGLQLMNAGSIYRFYFPYQLAFGEQGSGDIPGYTPFIYEVELHEIYNN